MRRRQLGPNRAKIETCTTWEFSMQAITRSSSGALRRSRYGAVAALCALILGGCANPWQEFQAGTPESTLVAHLGPPKEVYVLANGNRRLMWPTRPLGETTTAADIGPNGNALDVVQVLTEANFAQAQPQVWTKKDVLEHFGKPEETAYFPLMKRQVWSYRYVESNVWYMLYHFYFDDQGVLQLTQKTPDPLHDEERARF